MPIDHDQIGTVDFIRLDGPLHQPSQESEFVTREGVDGVGIRLVGSRGKVTRLRGLVDMTSEANVGTLHTTYASLVGSTQTIHQMGVDYANYFILSGVIVRKSAGVTGSGGVNGGAYLVESLWEVVYNAAS